MKTEFARVKLFTLVGLILLISSCYNNTDSLTTAQRSIVMDSVQLMVDSIAKAISHDGPIAWIRYFENSPDFYMASEGQLAFTNNDSLANFLKNTFTKTVSKIELSWSQVRIDPFTSKIAAVAAIFHEDITDFAGRKTPSDGYFTGIAHQTSKGWQLQNAHWSIIPTKKE
jgi:SnoaL-like domain